jgi:hypothetical protein
MDFFNILDGIGEFGLGGVIISLLTFIYWIIEKTFGIPSVISKLFYKLVDHLLKIRVQGLPQMSTIKESDVINHDIFNYLDFLIYSQVPTIQFSSDYRTIVFRKYLTIYLQKYRNNLHTWVTSKKFEEMDHSELWTSILSLINSTIYDYEKEMINIGIPKVIIEKMKVKNNDAISFTIDLLEGICNSEFYSTEKNLLKVYSILNIMLSVLAKTITSSGPICDSINGQLKGLTMDGITEN